MFDAVANFLIERGSPGVVIKSKEVRAYFAHSAGDRSITRDIQHFLREINGIYPDVEEPRLRCKVLRDRDWNNSWRRFFKPQKIGKAFWVTPPWATPPLLRHRQVLTIEPGMAFGTGTHATTRGCMELIEDAVSSLLPKEFIALDVGTGSGILAIALVKLGAKKVWALEADPTALSVARANFRCNSVQHRVYLSKTKLRRLKRSFPLVVANLTTETILDLARALENKVVPNGLLIVSGILKPKEQNIIRRFSLGGFERIKRISEKEWVTLLLRRE